MPQKTIVLGCLPLYVARKEPNNHLNDANISSNGSVAPNIVVSLIMPKKNSKWHIFLVFAKSHVKGDSITKICVV
jgi:hypothetical protein